MLVLWIGVKIGFVIIKEVSKEDVKTYSFNDEYDKKKNLKWL